MCICRELPPHWYYIMSSFASNHTISDLIYYIGWIFAAQDDMNSAVKAQMLMQDAPILQKSHNYWTTEDFINIKTAPPFTVHSLIPSFSFNFDDAVAGKGKLFWSWPIMRYLLPPAVSTHEVTLCDNVISHLNKKDNLDCCCCWTSVFINLNILLICENVKHDWAQICIIKRTYTKVQINSCQYDSLIYTNQ